MHRGLKSWGFGQFLDIFPSSDLWNSTYCIATAFSVILFRFTPRQETEVRVSRSFLLIVTSKSNRAAAVCLAISTIKRNKMTSVLSLKLVMKREKTAHTCDLTAFASTVSRLNAFDIFKHDKTPVKVFSIFSLGPFSPFYFELEIAISSLFFRSYKWAKTLKAFLPP